MTRLRQIQRAALSLVVATALVGLLMPSPAHAAAQVGPGKACASEGMQVRKKFAKKDMDKLFTCRLVNGKLRYGQGVSVEQIVTRLIVSQEWRGDQVTLSIFNSEGMSCTEETTQANVECQYFYLGWTANFPDEERTVSYSDDGIYTTISGLQIGDAGWFYIMYDNPDDNEIPFWVKRFRFLYD